MNRQVIPSMFLSVLIVCTFAIVLFERTRSRPAGNPSPIPSASLSGPGVLFPPLRRPPSRPEATRRGPRSLLASRRF